MRQCARLFLLILQLNPHFLELCYYRDDSKREKKGTIDLRKFRGLRPNARIGNKDHVFAIETEDRKYIFRAPSHSTKNIWIAKLWEFFGQGWSLYCIVLK